MFPESDRAFSGYIKPDRSNQLRHTQQYLSPDIKTQKRPNTNLVQTYQVYDPRVVRTIDLSPDNFSDGYRKTCMTPVIPKIELGLR